MRVDEKRRIRPRILARGGSASSVVVKVLSRMVNKFYGTPHRTDPFHIWCARTFGRERKRPRPSSASPHGNVERCDRGTEVPLEGERHLRPRGYPRGHRIHLPRALPPPRPSGGEGGARGVALEGGAARHRRRRLRRGPHAEGQHRSRSRLRVAMHPRGRHRGCRERSRRVARRGRAPAARQARRRGRRRSRLARPAPPADADDIGRGRHGNVGDRSPAPVRRPSPGSAHRIWSLHLPLRRRARRDRAAAAAIRDGGARAARPTPPSPRCAAAPRRCGRRCESTTRPSSRRPPPGGSDPPFGRGPAWRASPPSRPRRRRGVGGGGRTPSRSRTRWTRR